MNYEFEESSHSAFICHYLAKEETKDGHSVAFEIKVLKILPVRHLNPGSMLM